MAVVLESAVGVDHPGLRVDPPAEEVEVVAGLVDEKASRVALLPVPAPEVGGAVVDIQLPVEVHERELPDAAFGEELFHPEPMG